MNDYATTESTEPLPGTLRYAVKILAGMHDYDFAVAIRHGKINLVAKILDIKSRELIKITRETRGQTIHAEQCPNCDNSQAHRC